MKNYYAQKKAEEIHSKDFLKKHLFKRTRKANSKQTNPKDCSGASKNFLASSLSFLIFIWLISFLLKQYFSISIFDLSPENILKTKKFFTDIINTDTPMVLYNILFIFIIINIVFDGVVKNIILAILNLNKNEEL